jgi:16S rRNA (cytosine967-C5)-methyltransferase
MGQVMAESAAGKLGPRAVALRAIRDRGAGVLGNVDRLSGASELRSADRGLAMELASGVIKRRSTLAAVLRPLLRRPKKRLPVIVSDIMQLGLYQILFLDRVPAHAAVNETVKLAHDVSQGRHVGLINGVLRSAVRLYPEAVEGPPPLGPETIPKGPDSYYVAPGAIFGDPANDPAGYLAEAYSLPIELAARWSEAHNGLAGAAEIAMHANCRAPMIVRPNRLKTDTETLLGLLGEAEISADPHANGLSVVIHDRAEALASELFAEGRFQPQDATATAVCLAAAPSQGARVLDTCAAPGAKTAHLAELMDNSGEILAVDVPQKLELIETNCRRLGISIVRTMPASQLGSLEPQSFDLVLADVPCSNTGVLARRPEARWRFEAKSLAALVRDQRFLAMAAGAFVRPGGRLIYSTRSLEAEEGPEITRQLLRKQPALTLVSDGFIMPQGAADATKWCDGGYIAVFTA